MCARVPDIFECVDMADSERSSLYLCLDWEESVAWLSPEGEGRSEVSRLLMGVMAEELSRIVLKSMQKSSLKVILNR